MSPFLAFCLGSIGLFFIVLAAKAWVIADEIVDSLRREDELRERHFKMEREKAGYKE